MGKKESDSNYSNTWLSQDTQEIAPEKIFKSFQKTEQGQNDTQNTATLFGL